MGFRFICMNHLKQQKQQALEVLLKMYQNVTFNETQPRLWSKLIGSLTNAKAHSSDGPDVITL